MIKRISYILFHNFWYKAGSLALAVIVWGIVQGEEVVESNVKVRVTLSVANGYAVRGGNVRMLEATLRGPRVLIGDLTGRALESRIYIPSGQTGNLEIPFDRESIKNWDQRIRISVRDNFLNVFVDEKISREIPVREVLQGAPAEGYLIEKITIKPEKIKVSGLKADLVKIDSLITEPIDIDKINESKSFKVRLAPTPGESYEYSETEVAVQLQLGDSRINKRFEKIPLSVVGSEYMARVFPSFVTIVIQGTPAVLGLIDDSELAGFVEANGLKPGRYIRDVQAKIPPDTVMIQTVPEKITLEILEQKRRGL